MLEKWTEAAACVRTLPWRGEFFGSELKQGRFHEDSFGISAVPSQSLIERFQAVVNTIWAIFLIFGLLVPFGEAVRKKPASKKKSKGGEETRQKRQDRGKFVFSCFWSHFQWKTPNFFFGFFVKKCIRWCIYYTNKFKNMVKIAEPVKIFPRRSGSF